MSDYGCLMAPVPEPLASRLRGFSSALPDKSLYIDEDKLHGRDGEPHVTVLYGIKGKSFRFLSKLAGRGVIRAKLGSISVFDNENYIVLKVDVISDGLCKLNKFVKTLVNYDSKYPVYIPHITLAYLQHNILCHNYYKRFICDIFSGDEVIFDRLHYVSPYDKSVTVSLTKKGISEICEQVKTVVVDFDGTIARDDVEFPAIGCPFPDVAKALTELRLNGYRIVINTCRLNGVSQQEGKFLKRLVDLVLWLEQYGIPYDDLAMPWDGKPFGDFYVDDKAVRFNGNWNKVVDFIKKNDQ